MTKQELIERIEGLKNIFGNECEYVKIDFVIELASELDELEKVKIPQFVADWIDYCKRHNFTLFGCLDPEGCFESLVNETFEGDIRKCIRWCRRESNIFARAWLDGYEVWEVKRYRVKMKGMSEENTYLTFRFGHTWMLSNFEECEEFRLFHTRKELEESGFSWVFDCPGIEIKEV